MAPSRTLLFSLIGLILLSGVSWAGEFSAFGPESFSREKGDPKRSIRTFTVLNPSAPYTLHVVTSGDSIGEEGKGKAKGKNPSGSKRQKSF